MAGTLAPCLLLAAPQLGDPNFERTVVLLGRHEADGALGWVLNGAAVGKVSEVLEGAELVPEGLALPRTHAFRDLVRVGGPVQPQAGWLLYRRAHATFENELEVDALAVTSNPEALNAVMRGDEPTEFRLILGCAGWGAGQLEEEIREGTWLPAPLDLSLVLGSDPEKLWDTVVRAITGLSPETVTGRTWSRA